MCGEVTPTDEGASQGDNEAVPRGHLWSGNRGTQHVLEGLDGVLPVSGDAYGNKRFRQLDSEAVKVFHGEALDQELSYPVQEACGDGSQRERRSCHGNVP